MQTIKEYAESHSVTIQAVYQQINRKQNKEFISKNIKKINGVKYLNDEAVSFLESKRANSPSVIIQTGENEKIEQLENENKILLLKVTELQDLLLKEKDQIKQLQQDKILLLENSESQKRKWWQKKG